ncbi:hypothetical protein HK105_203553 [Polyrhizophydium stewartii]|uniref:Ankyrin repeat domain-containing protein n=1 Tax=Polyrhizophydium stewartii TaxID=2732419 RepID=A0ABR4NBF6_9FUNG
MQLARSTLVLATHGILAADQAAAQPAGVLLPCGASHWDRLPAELHDKVFSHTTPTLSRFIRRGTSVRAELDSISDAVREQLWREALESEWSGDLAALPRLRGNSNLPLMVSSRRMLDRMVSAGVRLPPAQLQRLAVRHGWTDLLDFQRPEILAKAAACEGHVALLAELDERRLATPTTWHARFAAEAGHLAAVMWLRSRMAGVEWPPAVMDWAAASGCLDLVVWLHKTAACRCTADAVDRAASNGHLHVVEWLAANTAGGCSGSAFGAALANGDIAVLDVLRQRWPSVLAVLDEAALARARHVSTLAWLRKHRPDAALARLLPHLIASGAVEPVEWLVDHAGARLEPAMVQTAIEMNHAALVEWLVARKGLAVDAGMFDSPRHGANTDALAWVARHDSRWAGVMADRFAATGCEPLVEWLHVRFRRSVTQSTLEAAVRAFKHRMVEFVVDRIDGVEWDLDRARQLAMAVGDHSAVQIIDERIDKARTGAQSQ